MSLRHPPGRFFPEAAGPAFFFPKKAMTFHSGDLFLLLDTFYEIQLLRQQGALVADRPPPS